MAAKMLVDPRITLATEHADNETNNNDEATAFKATLTWVKMLLPDYEIPKRSRFAVESSMQPNILSIFIRIRCSNAWPHFIAFCTKIKSVRLVVKAPRSILIFTTFKFSCTCEAAEVRS